MEKISSIIPSSTRVTNVDMKDSQPVRPGVPTFGRSVGRSSLRDNQRKSSVDTTLMDEVLSTSQKRDMQNAKLADQISKEFFMQKPIITEVTPPATFRVSTLPEEGTSVEEIAEQYEAYPDVELQSEPQPEPEYMAPGSYIDVRV